MSAILKLSAISVCILYLIVPVKLAMAHCLTSSPNIFDTDSSFFHRTNITIRQAVPAGFVGNRIRQLMSIANGESPRRYTSFSMDEAQDDGKLG